ncbi:3-hydroxy-acyl-CoA-dehydrogenase [Marasmius fiardii PR-910]|nr:3-hydroxy-acyl-CoA-dehydrogenase [Marasmius fiardii PR-910]
MKIENRTFVVSGGSSGLGLGTVHQLLEEKAFVSVLDLSSPPKDIGSLPRVKFFKTDITKVDEIEKAVDGTVEWTQSTGATLGGVINCAGVAVVSRIIDSRNEPHPLDLWQFALDVNLTGTFNLTRLVLKHLVKVQPESGHDGERGVVILVASSAAFEAQPGQVAYAATKGALRAMALPMARDLGRNGIRVMAIAPSLFDSSMTSKLPEKARRSLESDLIFPKRMGEAKEFAQTVKWILECSYVNGETVRLSGASRMPGKL